MAGLAQQPDVGPERLPFLRRASHVGYQQSRPPLSRARQAVAPDEKWDAEAGGSRRRIGAPGLVAMSRLAGPRMASRAARPERGQRRMSVLPRDARGAERVARGAGTGARGGVAPGTKRAPHPPRRHPLDDAQPLVAVPPQPGARVARRRRSEDGGERLPDLRGRAPGEARARTLDLRALPSSPAQVAGASSDVHFGQRVALAEIVSQQRGHSFVDCGFGRSFCAQWTRRKTAKDTMKKSMIALRKTP
jgi:hypothetical protein